MSPERAGGGSLGPCEELGFSLGQWEPAEELALM